MVRREDDEEGEDEEADGEAAAPGKLAGADRGRGVEGEAGEGEVSTEPVSVCMSCGRENTASLVYRARGLPAPRLCRGCFQRRQDRLVELPGVIEAVTSAYAFVLAADVHYFAPATVIHEPLTAGSHVVISVDPLARPDPGRKPRAHRLRSA